MRWMALVMLFGCSSEMEIPSVDASADASAVDAAPQVVDAFSARLLCFCSSGDEMEGCDVDPMRTSCEITQEWVEECEAFCQGEGSVTQTRGCLPEACSP